MGQKVHPIGFRLGIIRDWDSNWYADKNYAELVKQDHEIRSYLNAKLSTASLARIGIDRQAQQLRITLHTGKPGIIIGRGGRGVDDLKAELERKFAANITLNVQEIRQPDLDATLVAEGVAQQIEKRVAPRRAMRQAIQRSMRAGAQGIKVGVAGRLGGSEMARRESEKQGKIPLHTLRADVDYGFKEAMTTWGHIGVKVWVYRGEILPSEWNTRRERAETESFLPRPPSSRRGGPGGGDGGGPRRSRGGGGGGGGRSGPGGGGGGRSGAGGGGGGRSGAGGGGRRRRDAGA